MERLLKSNVPVEMEVEIKNNFFDSPKIYNVIGEIPGTDKILKNKMEDLKINAIITASFSYNAAMRNEKLPRKPVTQQQDTGPGIPGGMPPGM